MNKIKGELILLITALIWGLAFIFQSSASDYIGAFTFNGSRFLVGALSLVPLLKFNRHNMNQKKVIGLGIALGLCIGLGSNLQQFAIPYTSAGKAGFMTSLYMIMVPLISLIFYKKKASPLVYLAIVLALGGLYLLCGESFTFALSDILLILCALFFALQIVFIDQYGKDVNSVMLSFVQYLTAGIVSCICAFIFEDINLNNMFPALSAILYTGILSTGVAYTLQIIGQKYTDPSVASLILSLESVVAVFGGYFILHETLTSGELLGCALMFIAVILSQLRFRRRKNEDA